jgi:two-component system KDP operon response regulator KdpE
MIATHLTPKETKLLRYLIAQQGRVVPHRELLAAVWGAKRVDRLNYLHVFITNLRKKIESDPAHPRYILTTPWVGYSFSLPDKVR